MNVSHHKVKKFPPMNRLRVSTFIIPSMVLYHLWCLRLKVQAKPIYSGSKTDTWNSFRLIMQAQIVPTRSGTMTDIWDSRLETPVQTVPTRSGSMSNIWDPRFDLQVSPVLILRVKWQMPDPGVSLYTGINGVDPSGLVTVTCAYPLLRGNSVYSSWNCFTWKDHFKDVVQKCVLGYLWITSFGKSILGFCNIIMIFGSFMVYISHTHTHTHKHTHTHTHMA